MYKMTYSMDETQAMYAAVSEDMLRWTPFKEGEPVLDLRPAGRIIRDPFWFEFEGVITRCSRITGRAGRLAMRCPIIL